MPVYAGPMHAKAGCTVSRPATRTGTDQSQPDTPDQCNYRTYDSGERHTECLTAPPP